MTPNTFSVRIVVRTNRADKENYAPVYAKVTINNEVILLSLNRKISILDWLKNTESVKASNSHNKEVNTAIEALKTRIYQAHARMLVIDKDLNAENFKKAFYGETDIVKVPGLIETATQHNFNFEKMLGIKYSYGSYKNYKTTLKYLIEFVPLYCGKKEIPLKQVNYTFCEAFYTHITTVKTCQQNGANKQIQRLKKILNYGIKQGYISTNPMAAYTLEFTPVNKIALTMSELEKLHALDLQRDTLNHVRDAFLLQCYTGLSYGDVKRLTLADIHLISENEYWIKMNREKTKIAFSVPLLPQAILILNKYLKGDMVDGTLMPVLSNQKMNDNLKLIQELAGIRKNLTTHLARHTFATTITLGHGVPIETVSRMLGHTKLSTTQVYAKVLDAKIGQDMKNLEKKLK